MPRTERTFTLAEKSRMVAVGAGYCSCVGCTKYMKDDQLYVGEDLNPDIADCNKGLSRKIHKVGPSCNSCRFQGSHKTAWPDWVLDKDKDRYLDRRSTKEKELSTLDLNKAMQKLPLPLEVWDLTVKASEEPQTSLGFAAPFAGRPPPPNWAMQSSSPQPPPPPPAIHLPPSDRDRDPAWTDTIRGDNRYPYPHGGYREEYKSDASREYYSDPRDKEYPAREYREPPADPRDHRYEDPRFSSGSMQYGPLPPHPYGRLGDEHHGRTFDTEQRSYPSEYSRFGDDRASGLEPFRSHHPVSRPGMPPPRPIVKQESPSPRPTRGSQYTLRGGGPIRTTHGRNRSTGSANSKERSPSHPYWRSNQPEIKQPQIKVEESSSPPFNASRNPSPSPSLMPPSRHSAGSSEPLGRSGSDPNSGQGPVPRKPGDQYFGVKSPLWHDPYQPGACHESSHQVILSHWNLAPSSPLPEGFGTCTGCGQTIATNCHGTHWVPGTRDVNIGNGRMGCQRALFTYQGPSQDTAMSHGPGASG